MVAKYYVAGRPRTNDYHAVHKEGCPFLHDNGKNILLGLFKSGQDAMRESHLSFTRTEKCIFCCREEKTARENPIPKVHKGPDTVPVRLRTPVSYHQGMFCSLN
jgi:hypothetical protein